MGAGPTSREGEHKPVSRCGYSSNPAGEGLHPSSLQGRISNVTDDMGENFPEFASEDELREWFETVDLSNLKMDEALEIVVANSVRLVVGDDDVAANATGTTGSLREPVRLVTTQR